MYNPLGHAFYLYITHVMYRPHYIESYSYHRIVEPVSLVTWQDSREDASERLHSEHFLRNVASLIKWSIDAMRVRINALTDPSGNLAPTDLRDVTSSKRVAIGTGPIVFAWRKFRSAN